MTYLVVEQPDKRFALFWEEKALVLYYNQSEKSLSKILRDYLSLKEVREQIREARQERRRFETMLHAVQKNRGSETGQYFTRLLSSTGDLFSRYEAF